MKGTKQRSRLKWAILFVACDLAITAVIIAIYVLLSQPQTKTATKPTDLKTELKKVEEEATRHTGR